MKLLLINPPNGVNDTTYLAPPLGLLTLASFLRQHDYDVKILDLNLKMFTSPSLDKNFYEQTIGLVSKEMPDVIGFTSMCLESHVSLEIARRVKEINSSVVTLFGGTHFGAIPAEILERFDFVDFVIAGEGEHAILSILNKLSSAAIVLPENVTYRNAGKILRGLAETKRFAMEEIPFPAYDLIELDRYFTLNPSRLINYEAGRGCVFKCSFCYSPFHYGDDVRNKSPEKVVEELEILVELGAKHVFFVQDNLLNSPRWASELCHKLAAANLPLTWECYSTYPQLKGPTIELLANAGCIAVFTGIDAVAVSSQKRMNKPFLRDWKKTSGQLSDCIKNGITPTCAFILEEPDQDIETTDSTIYTALECVKLGCEIHLNTLSLYNGTELARKSPEMEYHYSSIKPELLLDTPKVVQENTFAKDFPNLFPYHSTYCNLSDWEIFTGKSHTLLALILGLPNTLHQFVVNERKSVWQVLDYIDNDFVTWMRNLDVSVRHEAAVLEFAKHFPLQITSDQTKTLFYDEIAILILSKKKNPRLITLSVNGNNYQAELAWFLNLEKFNNVDDFVDKSMLELSKGFDISLDKISISPRDTYEVALLSKNRKKIVVHSVSSDVWGTLSLLENASNAKKIVKLTDAESETLLTDEWLFIKQC